MANPHAGFKFHFQHSLAKNGYNCFIVQNTPTSKKIAEAISFGKLEEGEEPYTPVVTVDKECLQELMNDLWIAGFRPSHGDVTNKGEMAAMKYHLEDMRKIAFEFVNLQK